MDELAKQDMTTNEGPEWQCSCGRRDTHRKFKIAVRKAGGYKKAAELLGCSPSFIGMINAGSRCPGRDSLAAIQDELAIPVQEWFKFRKQKPATLSEGGVK